MVVELDFPAFEGFGEVVELTGRGFGGGFETRDGIEEVKSLILEGKVDVVLIMKVDRFCFDLCLSNWV